MFSWGDCGGLRQLRRPPSLCLAEMMRRACGIPESFMAGSWRLPLTLSVGGKNFYLSRYLGHSSTPRPESWKEDVLVSSCVADSPQAGIHVDAEAARASILRNIRAAAESVCPVSLRCLVHQCRAFASRKALCSPKYGTRACQHKPSMFGSVFFAGLGLLISLGSRRRRRF